MQRALNYLKIARFDHWVKQLFVLPGAWLAFVMINPIPSAAASTNYCINEWLDMEFDKFHPVKKTTLPQLSGKGK